MGLPKGDYIAGKRRAHLALVCMLLRVYFKLNNIQGCTQVAKTITNIYGSRGSDEIDLRVGLCMGSGFGFGLALGVFLAWRWCCACACTSWDRGAGRAPAPRLCAASTSPAQPQAPQPAADPARPPGLSRAVPRHLLLLPGPHRAVQRKRGAGGQAAGGRAGGDAAGRGGAQAGDPAVPGAGGWCPPVRWLSDLAARGRGGFL